MSKSEISHKKLNEEFNKCINNPYYFATTYLKVYDQDGDEYPFTTVLSEKEFNELILNYTNE